MDLTRNETIIDVNEFTAVVEKMNLHLDNGDCDDDDQERDDDDDDGQTYL